MYYDQNLYRDCCVARRLCNQCGCCRACVWWFCSKDEHCRDEDRDALLYEVHRQRRNADLLHRLQLRTFAAPAALGSSELSPSDLVPWPIATNFTLGPNVSFRGKAEAPLCPRETAETDERERA